MKFAEALVLSLAVGIVGCGGKTDGKTEVGNSGGGGNSGDGARSYKNSRPLKELMIGAWSAKLTFDEELFDKVAPRNKETADFMRKSFRPGGTRNLEFKADGTRLISDAGPDGKPGRTTSANWEVVGEDGTTLKLSIKPKGFKASTTTLKFISDDEFEYTNDSRSFQRFPFKKPFVFKRK